MARRSIVQIEARFSQGSEWGSGCVLESGHVLTAAHVVAPLGELAKAEDIVVGTPGSEMMASVLSALVPDEWIDTVSERFDMALLVVAWDGSQPPSLQVDAEWSAAEDAKTATGVGHRAPTTGGGLWEREGTIEHRVSSSGRHYFGSDALRPVDGASGGALLSIEDPARLVGIITGAPSGGAFAQIGLPMNAKPYRLLLEKLKEL
jgi:Trypsin-like peptidase domain